MSRQADHRHVVTRAELARLVRTTPDHISKRIAEGMPGVVRTGAGRGKATEIDLALALPWLLERRRTVRAGEDERARYFRLQGDKIEQEIRARAGELVEASDVEHRWVGMVTAARERLLALPSVALQRKLIAPDAEPALIGLVDQALTELAARGTHADRA